MPAHVSRAACHRLIGPRLAPDGSSAAENFRRWIDGSVTVNASGVPQLVFHATARDFSCFNVSLSDLGAHFGQLHQVHHLARLRANTRVGDDWTPDDVSYVSGCQIMPVWLRLLNPIRLRDEGSFHADGIAIQLAKRGLLSMAEAKRIHNECDKDWTKRKYADAQLKALMTGAGYDGVIYRNAHEGTGDSYIVFHANQVKSAIGNSGIFSLCERAEITDDWAWADESDPRDIERPRA